MKKRILMLFACVCMCAVVQNVQAQNKKDFNTLLTSFVELKSLEGVLAKDILKNTEKKLDDALAYEYLWNKDVYLKPENCNSYPIAYYKMNKGIVVVIFSNKSLDRANEYLINIQSYQNGKFINKRRGVISFKADGTSAYDIYISEDKRTILFNGTSGGKKLTFKQVVSKNGEVDKSN